MIQKQFIERVIAIVKEDQDVLALAVAGSWISNEADEYSDVDFLLFTKQKIGGDEQEMRAYANRLGLLLSAFTGEHVGDPRLLICLYDDPLLHVDIKFLTPDEYRERIENPVVVFERDGFLTNLMQTSKAQWPYPGYQWIEDRFWIWIHYAALKLGRGENFEALEFLSYLRTSVLAPLLQIKNGKLPRGVRKVETGLTLQDLTALKGAVPQYEVSSLFTSLHNCIQLYQRLRNELFNGGITLQKATEAKALGYLQKIKDKKLGGL